ncbi:hypothetical protein IW261DRAFT_1642691 [Armillaria novae-zelandiae]|uniref:Uncharacterized protein n=1 Tax=Armillaria novae-zelandiae TaxID=153914 RepID=A0AA39KEV2_9AGAR|nr:hypothetical protein IW261DRAFT_1642691 [Armillaria novae-zelandiae]
MIPTFLVIRAVLISLCKDPAITANDHLDQLQEYTSYLEHYKAELLKDKELKDSVFKACTGIKREYHANASKQPIHRVLKTITGWIQIERSQGAEGPPAGAPTGPHRDPKLIHGKGKAHSTRRSCATIDSESESKYNDVDKVAANSDSDGDSIKACTVYTLSLLGWACI